jgi:hypothetical protein
MEFIVGSLKAFLKLCNKKDFSHFDDWPVGWEEEWFGRCDLGEEVFGGDASEPIDIVGVYRVCRKNKIGRVVVQENNSDSNEEFSSAEDNYVSDSQNTEEEKKKKEKNKQEED